VVVGYSFRDTHLNEILFQRLREKRQLKIIIVHPKGEESVSHLPDLQENPRVHFIKEKSKEAFDRGLILNACKEQLTQISEEKPF